MKVFLKTEHRFVYSATNFQIIDSRFHEYPPYSILDDQETNSMHGIAEEKIFQQPAMRLEFCLNNVGEDGIPRP